MLPAITAVSLLLTPLAVAIIGYQATSGATSKDYVTLAISILNNRESSPESRTWAAALLEDSSPVPFPQGLQGQLEKGGPISATQIQTVNVPVWSPCPTPEIVSQMRQNRPPRMREEANALLSQDKRELAAQVILLQTYVSVADNMMDICSGISRASDARSGRFGSAPNSATPRNVAPSSPQNANR